MKKSLFISIFCIFVIIVAKGQDSAAVPEFGDVTITELQIKDCSFSPGASAMNLLKYKLVEVSLFPNGSTEVVTRTRYRVKIFNRNGYKNATVTIPVYDDNNIKIKDIRAATYNLNESGKVTATAVNEADIFKNDGKKRDAHQAIKFTWPAVQEGSVIEYEFVTRYKMAYEVPSWYFQDEIPNLLTVYKVVRPALSQLKEKVVSELAIEEKHEIKETKVPGKKELHDTYVLRNVPPFEREPYMSSPLDYVYRMDFLLGNIEVNFPVIAWSSANSWLLSSAYFGGAFGTNVPHTKSFIDSVKRLDNVPDKISAIYKYVKQRVKWNHVYYKYARELDEVWKEGRGTSAEINLSILNLLRRCGVQSFPVLYSTRQNGRVDFSFPDLSQFNTVDIAVINGKKFNLLDGTNPYLSFETPPFNVVNRTGMIIDPINNTQINIDFDRKLIWDSIFVSGSISRDGVLKGTVVKKYFDLAKSIKLQNIEDDNDNPDSKAERLISKGEIKEDTTSFVNIENETLPLIEQSNFHYDMPTTNHFYFLSPFLFANLSKNPFTKSTRISDVDFGAATSSIVQIKIALPKGMKLEELPKNKEIYNSDSSVVFAYNNKIKNDTIYISSSIEMKKPVIDRKEYGNLKKSFEEIYGLLNNQILLRIKDEN